MLFRMNTPLVRPTFTLPTPKNGMKLAAIAFTVLSLQACAVIAVTDAAVTVVATGVKVTAKAVGAVAGAVLPD